MPLYCQARKDGGSCSRKRVSRKCVEEECDEVMLSLDSYPIKWGQSKGEK